MSDCESDLTIDLKSDDFLQKDYPVPSTSSQIKLGFDEYEKINETDIDVSENYEDSDSETGEHCAICLSLIRGKVGSPDAEGCEHYFCLLCILEWTKNNPTCPQDRRPFKRILVRENTCGDVISTLEANESKADEEILEVEDVTYCEVCGSCEREDSLLLCDGCDLGFHLECLSPPLSEVPIEEWFCPNCVDAELPQVVSKPKSLKQIEKDSKNHREEKKRKLKSRMIPRTRASERVLRRINRTRNKEAKREGRNKQGGEESKRAKAVLLFRKAKPFGRIADNDVDAAFNRDEFADKLLSSSSSSLSNAEKRDIAVKTLSSTYSIPLPSYSGRSTHPKLGNCQTLDSKNSDILVNILVEQDTLLSKTKDVSLTKERKLIKKEGAKSLDFNLDTENRVMSKLLPSQKKALESNRKEVKTERENSQDTCRDLKDRKYEEKNKPFKDNFSNGHSSSYKHSYSSPRKSKNKNSYSSYKSKSCRNYDKNLDRRYDHDYRNKDMRRIKEKTSRERKDYRKSDDYYDRRRSRRSRSKSWERKRIERKHKHRSKTPEAYKGKEKKFKGHFPASSFWGKSYDDTFAGCEHKSNSNDDNFSFHTPEILRSSQENEVLYNIPNESVELPDKKVNNLSKAEELSFEICPSISTLHENTFGKSEWEQTLEASYLPLKCDNNKNNLIEEKRKLEGSDYRNATESKKQRLKNLFGDEESDIDSPIDHFQKFDSSVISNNESQEDVLQKETLRQNLQSENDQILNTKKNKSSCSDEVLSVDHGQNMLLKSPASPICLTSPSYSSENTQDGLGDITTLSKSSRDLILKSVFGNFETKNQGKSVLYPTKIENKESNVITTVESMVDHLKQKFKINYIDNAKEGYTQKSNFDSSLVEPRKITDKTNKIFSNLFGDSSDSEASNSALDKNSGKVISTESSKGHCELQETIVTAKDSQNSSEPSLVQKPCTPETSNKIVKNETEKKNKLNNEGMQEIDSRSSILTNKVKVNKLHLEMKVVDETKKFLNPFYLEKGFSKQIYKEIVSKCVNKVLEVESGNTVDPKKIQKLVNGYVQVYMHRNKKNTSNGSSSAPPPKPIV